MSERGPVDFRIWHFPINFFVKKCFSLRFKLVKWNFTWPWFAPLAKNPSDTQAQSPFCRSYVYMLALETRCISYRRGNKIKVVFILPTTVIALLETFAIHTSSNRIHFCPDIALSSWHFRHGEPSQGEVSMPAVWVVVGLALTITAFAVQVEVALFMGPLLWVCI